MAKWLGWGIAAAGVSLAGCGSPPDGRIEVRYMAWGNPQQLRLEQDLCDEFTRSQSRIRVKFIQVPASAYGNKMILMLASRTAPDVMRVDHYSFPALVKKDYFHSLDGLIAKDPTFRLADFFPLTVEEGRFEGKVYGLNVLFGGPIIHYNKDLIRAANLEDPYAVWKRGDWTWDRYRQYAAAMTTRDARGKPRTFGSNINDLPQRSAVIYTFGGSLMDPDQKRATFGEGKSKEALRFLYDLRFRDKVEPTAAQAANSLFAFDGGKLGFGFDWMGATPRLRKAATFDWDVVPLPVNPGGTTMVKGNQLVMSAESRHPEAAWEFMKFMTGEATERKLYVQLRRSFPTRKAIAYSREYFETGGLPPQHIDVFVKSIERGRVLPITSRWAEWTRELNSTLEPLFNGTTTDFDGTLRRAQQRANDALATKEGL